MNSIDVNAIISQNFPKSADCLDGHLGPEVISIEKEVDDDRYYEIKVTRCGHCNIPLYSEYL
jgi:hypothetical protein